MAIIQALTAVAALISVTNAHMVITSPVPMGKSVLTNSPLAADGSDFPCKNSVSGWDNIADGGGNVMSVGESNTLAFMGGATHGGGSCQVSITSDTPPTANSKWMVIQSIEGNCPSSSLSDENTSGSPTNTAGLNTFQYSIPDHPDIPAGKNYTLAWTWNNRIGNREFYMNCASVQLEAAKKKRFAPEHYKRQSSSLPAMFVANIGSGCDTTGCPNGCTVPEDINLQYPDPGSAVTIGQGLTFTAPKGNCGAVSNSSPSNSNSSSPSSPSASAASAANSSSPATAVSQSVGGSFATNSAGSGQSVPATSAPAVATSSPAAPASPNGASSVASAAPAASTGSSTASGTQSGACSNEGEWFCAANGQSFQRCASGQWSVPMQMSAGTTCTPGTTSFDGQLASLSGTKRSFVARRHAARARRTMHM